MLMMGIDPGKDKIGIALLGVSDDVRVPHPFSKYKSGIKRVSYISKLMQKRKPQEKLIEKLLKGLPPKTKTVTAKAILDLWDYNLLWCDIFSSKKAGIFFYELIAEGYKVPDMDVFIGATVIGKRFKSALWAYNPVLVGEKFTTQVARKLYLYLRWGILAGVMGFFYTPEVDHIAAMLIVAMGIIYKKELLKRRVK